MSHVPPQQLREFRWGRVASDADCVAIASHLEACHQCQTTFDHLPDNETVSLAQKCLGSSASTGSDGAHFWPLPPEFFFLQEHWNVERLLGHGGMGVVYLARPILLQGHTSAEPRALKIIHAGLVVGSAAHRLQREIDAICNIPRHPNLVAGYGATKHGPYFVLEMDYVPGDDLERACPGPIDASLACGYVLQALHGLDHAHQTRQTVHRDIKPSNLIVTPDGVVKILDFGLAKALGDDDSSLLTRTGWQGGTAAYSAPEQSEGLKQADLRSDLYGLGCTLYRLLTGHPPFGPHAGQKTPLQVVLAHRDRKPERVSKYRPDVPPALEQVIAKLLAKKPEERYQTAVAAAQDLATFADEASQRLTHNWIEKTKPTRAPSRDATSTWATIAVCLLLVAVAFGTMFQVRTKAGMVMIDVADEDVTFTIDDKPADKTLVRLQHKDGKKWLTIEAAAGTRKIKVSKPGFEVFSDDVIVKLGKASPVHVTLVPEPPPVVAKKWVPLFNGRDLQGWKQGEGGGEWKVTDGVLDGSDATREIVTERSNYKDFHLRMEVLLTNNANSGIFIRQSEKQSDPHYECELWFPDLPGRWYTLGTIHRVPKGGEGRGFGAIVETTTAKPDRWFVHEIIIRGGEIQILIDGERVSHWTDPEPVAPAGVIGLGNFNRLPGQKIQFRKIEIQELP